MRQWGDEAVGQWNSRRPWAAELGVASLVLAVALAATPAAQSPSQPAPARLSGIWDLNHGLSTKPMAAQGDPGGEGGRGGRPGTGRVPGGGGMGGRRGGGMAGRGGGLGGGGRGGSAGDMRQARAVLQELRQPPARLTIVSSAAALTITDPEGVVRKFALDGKNAKVAINGSTVEVKSQWDGEVLTQEFKAGSAKFIRTLETTVEGHQLVITVTSKGDGGGVAGPALLRFVYDKGNAR